MGATASIQNNQYELESKRRKIDGMMAVREQENLQQALVDSLEVQREQQQQQQRRRLQQEQQQIHRISPPMRLRSMSAISPELSSRLQCVILANSKDPKLLSATFRFAAVLFPQRKKLPLDPAVTEKIAEWGVSGPGRNVVALRTDGDGNCLVHALCLAMFGSHDRNSHLRGLLTNLLQSGDVSPLLEEAWQQVSERRER